MTLQRRSRCPLVNKNYYRYISGIGYRNINQSIIIYVLLLHNIANRSCCVHKLTLRLFYTCSSIMFLFVLLCNIMQTMGGNHGGDGGHAPPNIKCPPRLLQHHEITQATTSDTWSPQPHTRQLQRHEITQATTSDTWSPQHAPRTRPYYIPRGTSRAYRPIRSITAVTPVHIMIEGRACHSARTA